MGSCIAMQTFQKVTQFMEHSVPSRVESGKPPQEQENQLLDPLFQRMKMRFKGPVTPASKRTASVLQHVFWCNALHHGVRQKVGTFSIFAAYCMHHAACSMDLVTIWCRGFVIETICLTNLLQIWKSRCDRIWRRDATHCSKNAQNDTCRTSKRWRFDAGVTDP